MANPPFTGSIDKSDINEDLTLSTTKTELLFVETMVRMLRKGGTAGVIVPQGVLFGSGKAFVAARQILVDRCELKAVITMPSGVFKPYAGVSTAILVFTKVYDKEDTITEPATQNVWFHEMESDGYPLDDRRKKFDTSGDLHKIELNLKLKCRDWTVINPLDIEMMFGPEELKEQITTWDDVYGIQERYKAKCCGENDGKYWIEQILDEWREDDRKPDDFLKTLPRNAEKKPYAEANFLKEPFLKACKKAGLFDNL